MIKYIASDLDGTLLQNGAQKPDNETLELIRRLTEAGIHFIAASGRQYINMYRMFGPVQDMISYVSENGALVMDQHKAVTKGSLDRDLVLRITEYAKGYPACNCQLSCESYCYTDSKDPFYIKHMTDVVQYDMAVVDNLADIKEPFLKLAMCDFSGKGTSAIEPFFRKEFGDAIKIVTSGNEWIDFVAPDINKGTALEKLVHYLGFDMSEGIAFGDQFNDIEMLQMAGDSYALSGCAPGVEAYANHMTDSVQEVLKKVLAEL